MQVITPVDPKSTAGKTKEIYDAVEHRLRRVPNMIQLMGNSPAILAAYLRFNEVFDESKISPKLRGLITATVSEINGCDYTLSIAYALGKHEGLSDEELRAARGADSADSKIAAALRFAAKVVSERGHVAPQEVESLRNGGYSDEEIVEIIGIVVLNIFRNYFNLIAGTEVDFPLVKTHRAA